MTEVGLVKSVNAENAVVRINRKSECSKCGACGFGKLANHLDITMKNTCEAKVGDNVVFEMTTVNSGTAAMIVYLIPLLLAVAGVFIGINFISDLFGFILAIAFLAIGFVIVHFIDKRIKKNQTYVPQMKSVISKEDAARLIAERINQGQTGSDAQTN